MELIFMLLFGFSIVCPTIGLTVPKRHSAFGVLKRADSVAFVTRYGAFDHKDTQNKTAGSPRLRPIADVFMAMNSASPTLGRVSSTPATVSPTPVFGGPGPLLLPSPALSPLISPTSSLNDLPVGDNTNTTPTPSKQFVVLGTIAGGILFFTFCIFLIMSPSCNGSFCGWGHLRRKRTNESINQEKPDAVSWVDVPSPPPVAERLSLETVKDIRVSDNLATGHTVLDIVSALASTDEEDERINATSKFSMCSSEYTSSFSSIDNDSDVQETMVRKVMQHRRSRSASGWAYPSRSNENPKIGRIRSHRSESYKNTYIA